MKSTKKQQRHRFTHSIHQESSIAQQEINEDVGVWDPEFDEVQDQGRDERLVDNIQRAIEEEAFLSTVLENIQVMANSGVITLEGVVFTEQEKFMAGEKAAFFAGFNNINNNLEVIGKN